MAANRASKSRPELYRTTVHTAHTDPPPRTAASTTMDSTRKFYETDDGMARHGLVPAMVFVSMWLVTTSSPWFGPMAWATFDTDGSTIEFALDGQFNVVVYDGNGYTEYHGSCADMDHQLSKAAQRYPSSQPPDNMKPEQIANLHSHDDEDFQRCVSARSLSTAVFGVTFVFFALVTMGHLRYGSADKPDLVADMVRPWLSGLLVLLIIGHMISVGTADHYGMIATGNPDSGTTNGELASAMPWAPYTFISVFAILPLCMDMAYAFMPK